MGIHTIEPDEERVASLCQEFKNILESTLLRDPSSNTSAFEEIKAIRAELEGMGLTVTWKASLLNLDGGQIKVSSMSMYGFPRIGQFNNSKPIDIVGFFI